MKFFESKSIQTLNKEVVFSGTDTAVSILFNYLKAGKTTESFLDDYPKVGLEKVLDVLELAENQLETLFSSLK